MKAKYAIQLALCVALALALGCSKKDDGDGEASTESDESGASTDTVETGDDKPDETADDKPDETADDKPDETAEPAESAEAAQCKRILEKAWTAVQPTLEKVGVDPAELEERYKEDKNFIERCSTVEAAKRDCMEKADNPIVGLHECEVNPPKAQPRDKVFMPSIYKRPEREALSPERKHELQKAVVGTWVNDWKSFGQKTTWKIDADGKVAATVVRKGETKKSELGLMFEKQGRVKVQTTPTSTQTYSFLMLNKKKFLASNNQAYDAHPVESKDKFVLPGHSNYYIKDGDDCLVVGHRGLEMPAKCKWSKKVLTFSWNDPGRNKPDGTPRDLEHELHYMADNMVDGRMVDMALFKKK